MCVYVCLTYRHMCVYICLTYRHMCVYICLTYRHMCVYICLSHIHMCVYVCLTYRYTHSHICIHVCIHTSHMLIYRHKHTDISIQTYSYMHAYMGFTARHGRRPMRVYACVCVYVGVCVCDLIVERSGRVSTHGGHDSVICAT